MKSKTALKRVLVKKHKLLLRSFSLSLFRAFRRTFWCVPEVKTDVTSGGSKESSQIVLFSRLLLHPHSPHFCFPFSSVLPLSKNGTYLGLTWEVLGRNMGGTFSCHLRYFFAFHSMPKRSSIEEKAKFYRTSIEHLSKTYRRSIEHLSKTYRRPIEYLSKTYRRGHVSTVLSTSYSLSFAPNNGYIAKYLLIDRYFSFSTFKIS